MFKGLKQLCEKIKDLGFLVKLDSNGSNPEILKGLIDEHLIDYIAMDVKCSLDEYEKVSGVKVNKENLRKSISLIMNSGIDYEFRTTLIPDVIDETEIEKIGLEIMGAKNYFLQQFQCSEKAIDKKYRTMNSLSKEKVESLKKIAEKFVENVGIRNLN